MKITLIDAPFVYTDNEKTYTLNQIEGKPKIGSRLALMPKGKIAILSGEPNAEEEMKENIECKHYERSEPGIYCHYWGENIVGSDCEDCYWSKS
jgi:hypothetical protein